MIVKPENSRIANPFLIKDKGVIYGVDIGNGFVSYFDLEENKIQIEKYISSSKELGSFSKKKQLEFFDEYNLGMFPPIGKSNFKVDGYCKKGNYLLFEITNNKVNFGIEIILKTYSIINSLVMPSNFSKIIRYQISLPKETFQVCKNANQYLVGIIETPNSIEELEKIILPKNLIFFK